MKKLRHPVFLQLITVTVFISIIIFLSLSVILPQSLVPVYENEIYYYLEEPLRLIDDGEVSLSDEVAYLFLNEDKKITTTANFENIIGADINFILSHIDSDKGKFRYNGEVFYYGTSYDDYVTKIAITDSRLISHLKSEIINKILILLSIIVTIILGFILWWARILVLKTSKLKEKIDILDQEECLGLYRFDADDEFKAISNAIDDMHFTLKEQEEYKNQMYQSISHDFKTPITVIKSYIEAINDGFQDTDEGLKIINNQIKKLESKVFSLLYINKINYIRESKNYEEQRIDVLKIVNESIEKFKVQRPSLKWKITGDTKTIFKGTYDMWEAIVDNMFNNFLRYAENKIVVTFKNGKITFYNDGPNIDPANLHDLFMPFKKGVKGEFGLGLSIIKKTISLFGYDIDVKNEKNGVSFIIK